jgi:hypothetical protein
MSTPQRIKTLEAQRQRLIDELLRVEQMLRGKFGVAYRRCGTPTCWCADSHSQGHPMNRITWTEQSVSRTKAIREEDIAWVKERTKTYKRFRKNRQALRVLERKINAALDAVEEKTVQRTRKLRSYL